MMEIGILGAGQLGRMLVLAGAPLGLRFRLFDSAADATAGQLAPLQVGRFDDFDALRNFAAGVDVVTFDWENVPVAAARAAAQCSRVLPSPRALQTAQDRLAEKKLFQKLGIAVAPHAAVDSAAGLARAVARVGLPGILKTRRLGYDGKGQFVLRRASDLDAAWRALGGQPLIYEGMVDFDCEVSLIGARGRDGRVAFYPLSRNVHHQGILSTSMAPFGDRRLQRAAESSLGRVLESLRYVGVLCVEFFVTEGRLVANEMAPRVHNSGHWTIEGAVTSQFENHLRAIAGLPLGDTRALGHSAMINCVGNMPPTAAVLALPGVHLHDYGKAPRPGRKLGHLTYVGGQPRERDRMARALLRLARD
jgi:5-(carboxyamino)imidazole ribonucleotide synthase